MFNIAIGESLTTAAAKHPETSILTSGQQKAVRDCARLDPYHKGHSSRLVQFKVTMAIAIICNLPRDINLAKCV
jgi:hypothetical protein